MNPIQFSVRNPYMVAVAVILLTVFSLLALRAIPVQLKPTVDKPLITISTSFRGASAAEVEEQLTRELEEVLQSVQGVVEMTSESAESRSTITLEFAYGMDIHLAAIDVANQLTRVEKLPAEADRPAIALGGGQEDSAAMWIAVKTSYDANYALRLVQESARARIERVTGVSSLFVVGGSDREIQVQLDTERMTGLGVEVREVLDALGRGNLNLRGGAIETRGRQLAVRTVGRALKPGEIEALVVRETAGGSVRIGDIGRVVDTYRESTGFVNIDGRSGVAIGVNRMAGANVVALVAEMDRVLGELNTSFANRGLDLSFEPVYRETVYIEKALEFVRGNVWVGSALAIAVLSIFLRSWQSVLIIALSLPISLVAVFLVMQAFGRTLNVISLAGLAFASGMVVDNAIVVIDNIYRHMQQGKSALQASIDGGREVWGGVLGSTLTTAAVFIPILLQHDEASQLFVDIALAIAASVLLSMVVALTVVPVLTSLFYRNSQPNPRDVKDSTGMWMFGHWYARFTHSLADRSPAATAGKIGFILIVTALSAWSIVLKPEAEYLPAGNQNLIFYFASPVPGTRPEAVALNFEPLEKFILAQKETESCFAVTGPFFNGGGVVLKQEYATSEALDSFHKRLFGPAMTLAGFQYCIPIRASLFSDSGKQFEVELSGPDFGVLASASETLQGRLQAVEGVLSVRSSLVTGKPELRVVVDEKRAKELGLDVAAVGEVVETFVAGRRSSALVDGGREIDVNVLAPQARIESTEDLAALRFVAPGGQIVPLSAVADLVPANGPESIRRLERERNVLLTVNIAQDAPLERVVTAVEAGVFPALGRELGASYTLAIGGSGDKLKNTLDSITSGFGLSLLIIYLLMVALFSSWIAPIIILVTVPLSISGGLIGIRIANEFSNGQAAFDVISMLGFIILAGIVVNNAILIVHQANNFRASGMEPQQALATSSQTRLRPILMTVITTVVGMLPLAIGGGAGAELYQGLGAVIVGGLTVSTLLTLFLIPVILSLQLQFEARRTA